MQVIMEVSRQTRVLGLECDCRQLRGVIRARHYTNPYLPFTLPSDLVQVPLIFPTLVSMVSVVLDHMTECS